MRRPVVWMLAALCTGALAGCGGSSTSPSGSDPVDDLVVRLNAAGLAVVPAGPIEQLQAFGFPSAGAAAAAAATVSRFRVMERRSEPGS